MVHQDKGSKSKIRFAEPDNTRGSLKSNVKDETEAYDYEDATETEMPLEDKTQTRRSHLVEYQP